METSAKNAIDLVIDLGDLDPELCDLRLFLPSVRR